MTETAPETTDNAEAPGGEENAVTEVTEQATDWRADLPDELRSHPTIQKFTTKEGIAKSYVNLESMLGADKVPIPKGDEGWDAFYKAGGRPDEPTGYELAPPDGLPEGFYNPDSAEWFRGVAHEAGLNKTQAQKLHNEFVAAMAAGVEESASETDKARTEAEAALRKEWGSAFEARLQAAQDIVTELGGEDFAARLEATGLGNDPAMVKVFAQVAEALKGDGALVGTGGGMESTATIDAQISEYRVSNKEALFEKLHPDHMRAVDGLRALYEKRHPE